MENIIDQKVEKLPSILVQGLIWKSSPGIPIHFETSSKLSGCSRLQKKSDLEIWVGHELDLLV